MGPNGRRNLLASIGTMAYIGGMADGIMNFAPDVAPATFFVFGTTLLVTSVTRRKK